MSKAIDLTGETFGRLTVLKRAENDKYGRAMWECVCVCGSHTVIGGKSLRNGHTQSCGCLNKERISESSLKNLIGKRYGRLTVVERADDYIAPSNGKHHVMWRCMCDCGTMTTVDVCQLVQGHTKSCGCLHRELLSRGAVKHNGRHDRLYKVWANMKNRCYNQNSDDYKYYGGRGITICDEWRNEYMEFKKWAYAAGYDDSADKFVCTIDRIDVDGNYEPNNCRWVGMAEQSKNRRNVINKDNDKCPRKDTL